MKRYVAASRDNTSWDDLDGAVSTAKILSQKYGSTYYVFELVGAVHPGKPRWRPTERKERVEKPKDDERLNYKIRVLCFAEGKQISVIREIRAISSLGLLEAKNVSEGLAYLEKTATPQQFDTIKRFLENAGATIDFVVSQTNT